MASHGNSKESSFFLWMIVPAAVLLTLLFVRWNDAIAEPKEMLDGSRGASVTVPHTPHQHDADHSGEGEPEAAPH